MKTNRRNIFKGYEIDILAVLVFSVTLFLFAPLNVFLVNLHSITFSLMDVLIVYLVLTISVFLFLSIIAVVIKRFTKIVVLPLVFFLLSFCLWVQGTFLNISVGQLNGAPIEWAKFTPFMIRDLVVWIFLIIIGTLLNKVIQKNIIFGLGLILFVQSISLGIGFITNINSIRNGRSIQEDISQTKALEFSSKKNVVIVVLDSFQSTFFSNVLTEYPEYQMVFKDFTFFSNASSGYPTTKAAIPFILSGKYYNNSIPISSFLNNTANESLPSVMKENGFTSQYYTFLPYAYLNAWSEIATIADYSPKNKIIFAQYQIAFSRYFPSLFRKAFLENYYSGASYFHEDMVDFYNNVEYLSKSEISPTFKFIHLSGVHAPSQLDETLRYDRNSQKSTTEQALASLKVLNKLFDQMKSKRVYDNTFVIVTADHGAEVNLLGDLEQNDNFKERSVKSVVESAMPLLMLKDFNVSQEKLVESESPVSTGDIAKTIVSHLGIKSDFSGVSMLESIPENRARTFMYYIWSNAAWNEDFLPTFYQYTIVGQIGRVSSWTLLSENKSVVSDKLDPPINLKFGENLVGDNLKPSTNSSIRGFSPFGGDQPSVYWATGPSSCVLVNTPIIDHAFNLHIEGQPFLFDGVTEQKIKILVDQQKIGEFINGTSMSLVIPSALSKAISEDNKISLCLIFPNAVSPKEVGLNNDGRKLGYAISALFFSEFSITQLPFLEKINMSTSPSVMDILFEGWSRPEKNFTWTDGRQASILAKVDNQGKDVEFAITCLPFLGGGSIDYQEVEIYSNDQLIGNWSVDKEGRYSIRVPADTIPSGLLYIKFIMSKADSIVNLKKGDDPRMLGIAIEEISISVK